MLRALHVPATVDAESEKEMESVANFVAIRQMQASRSETCEAEECRMLPGLEQLSRSTSLHSILIVSSAAGCVEGAAQLGPDSCITIYSM